MIKHTIKDRKAIKKKAWTLFATRMKERDGYTCVTCGATRDTQVIAAGHFCHNREDFNEMNINAQCMTCNWRRKGNMRYYTLYLVKKYGIEEVENLLLKEKEKPKLESYDYYQGIIRRYSGGIKES